jgi:hypothetical protein
VQVLAQARLQLERLYEQAVDLLDFGPLPDADESFIQLLRKGLRRNERLYV